MRKLSWSHRFWLWLRNKATKKVHNKLLNRCGGLQTCTYCNQVVQEYKGSVYVASEDFTDLPNGYEVLTCGNCGGQTLWLWAIGMMYMGGYKPPVIETWQEQRLRELQESGSMPVVDPDATTAGASEFVSFTPGETK